MDGDFILPALAVQRTFGAFENGGRVKAIFIDEQDEDQIVRNYGFREPEAGAQTKRARVSQLHNDWLRREASQLNVPVIAARPWDTVFERILAALAP